MSGIAELLADPAATDDAVARAVGAADATDVEVATQLESLVRDEERLQRHPAIVGALFHNARAPMALVNQAVAVCARAGVRVDQIPSFDEVADALNAELVAASDVEARAAASGAAPSAFDEALAE